MLTKRKNEGDHEDDIDYIYEDEKSLIEDFKKANPNDKEKDAVKEYTSGNHKDMNGYLRGTKTGVEKDHRFCDYIADKTDKRNMGNTKLIMYLKVLPKEAESPAMNAA